MSMNETIKNALITALQEMVGRIEENAFDANEITALINALYASDAQAIDPANNTNILTPKSGHTMAVKAIADWVGTAPEVLDTIQEIVDALGGDPDAFNTLMSAITQLRTDLTDFGLTVPLDMQTDKTWISPDFAHFESKLNGFYYGTAKAADLNITDSKFDPATPVVVAITVSDYLTEGSTPAVGEENRKSLMFTFSQGKITYRASRDSEDQSGTLGADLVTDGEMALQEVDFTKAPWKTVLTDPASVDLGAIPQGIYVGQTSEVGGVGQQNVQHATLKIVHWTGNPTAFMHISDVWGTLQAAYVENHPEPFAYKYLSAGTTMRSEINVWGRSTAWFSRDLAMWNHYQNLEEGVYFGAVDSDVLDYLEWLPIATPTKDSACKVTVIGGGDIAVNVEISTTEGYTVYGNFVMREAEPADDAAVAADVKWTHPGLSKTSVSTLKSDNVDWSETHPDYLTILFYQILELDKLYYANMYGSQVLEMLGDQKDLLLPEERGIKSIPFTFTMYRDENQLFLLSNYTLPDAVLIRKFSKHDGKAYWSRIDADQTALIDVMANALDRKLLPEGTVATGLHNHRIEVLAYSQYIGSDDANMCLVVEPTGHVRFYCDPYTIASANGHSKMNYALLPDEAADPSDYQIKVEVVTDTDGRNSSSAGDFSNVFPDGGMTLLEGTYLEMAGGRHVFGTDSTLDTVTNHLTETVYTITIKHKPTGTETPLTITLATAVQQ